MARMLANENVPADVVAALLTDGHDVTWMRDAGPGSPDDQVLALAFAEGRIVLTFDKDFGELAFRLGQRATPGVILLRPRLRSPDYLVRFTRAVLAQGQTWEGHFAVAEGGRSTAPRPPPDVTQGRPFCPQRLIRSWPNEHRSRTTHFPHFGPRGKQTFWTSFMGRGTWP